MKKIRITLLCAILAIWCANMANAQNLGDVLGGLLGGGSSSSTSSNGSSSNSTLGNILEGVFSSSKLSVADLAGTWTTSGPAVCFKSENFLQQAGGVAAAAMIENKLDPYYKQYGLNGAVFNIQKDGTFTLTLKKMKLSGTFTKGTADGEFVCSFTALGGIKIGSFTTYVQKSYSSIDIMFDATKMKTLISAIAKFTGNTLAKTAASVLDSYDGLCVGFKATGQSASGNNTNQSIGDGIGNLLNVLGGKK